MKRKKNVIPVDRQVINHLMTALNHIHQALRHVNQVSLKIWFVTEPLEESKRKLLEFIMRLEKE